MNYWKELSPDIFLYIYDIGIGPTNSVAFKLDNNQIIVISPPTRLTEEAFKEIESKGEVFGLVAPNFFHYLGFRSWQKRFPKARTFAPKNAHKRLERKTQISFEPISSLTPFLGDKVKTFEFDFIRTGEVLFLAKMENGWCWYITDLLTNFKSMPGKLSTKLITFLLIARTGLHTNRMNRNIFMTDRKNMKKWFLSQIDSHPPKVLVTGHGEHMLSSNLKENLLNVIESEY